jgi:DHA2 family methylenomycin A resistance protein-like MFS transporter
MNASAPISTEKSLQEAGKKKAFALLGLSLGYFMVLLDTTIVTVALPAMQNDMGGKFASYEWVVNAYTVLFASLLLSMGSLSDRYGAKRIFVGGLVLFVVASVLCCVAPALDVLIVLRGGGLASAARP